MSRLKILVPIKRVLDYAVKPRIKSDKSGIDLAGAKMSMNPFCELAVEESLRIREKNKSVDTESIVAVSLGPSKTVDVLRTALAMGVDKAIHVDTGESPLEPIFVSKVLKAVVEREKSNLVILGKQSIDNDFGHTGPMLAGALGWSQATCAAKIAIDGEHVKVVEEVDGGVQTVSSKLPMIITTDLRLNEPRYASLPNIMKAKKKPLEKITPSDLGIENADTRLEILQVTEPAPRKGGVKVESVDDMIQKLKELGAL